MCWENNKPKHKEHLVATLREMFPLSGAFWVKITTPHTVHLLLFVNSVPVCLPFSVCLLFKAAELMFDTCLYASLCLFCLSVKWCLSHGCNNRPEYGVAESDLLPVLSQQPTTILQHKIPCGPETIFPIEHRWEDSNSTEGHLFLLVLNSWCIAG